MALFSNLLDLNKVTAKTAFLVLIISSCLLFFPAHLITQLQLTGFKSEFGKYFGIAFIGSLAFLIVAFLNWMIGRYNSAVWTKKFNKTIEKSIRQLDPKEIAVLREFVINGQQSMDMPIDNPVVAGLLNKGILYQLSSTGMASISGIMFPLAIREKASDRLTMQILGLPVGEPNERERQKILNERPDWAIERDRMRSWRSW